MITKVRFIKEGNSSYVETIVFTEDSNGFILATEDPEKKWSVVSMVSPAFDYSGTPSTDPYTIATRPGVQVLTPQEYDTEKTTKQAAVQQSIDDAATANAALPPSGISYSDSEKEFLIDYHGQSYKIVADKRQWFNIQYRFDPVDDDPRNIV